MGYEDSARTYHRNGNNCAMSVYAAYAEKLGISPEEAVRIAPKPRAEGGKCGAYLAGVHILSELKPEAVPEFEKRFEEMYGNTECAKLLFSKKKLGKNCNDFVGDTARVMEELLNQ